MSGWTKIHQSIKEEQYNQWIHGKYFFRQHIVPTLNQYLESRPADDWLADLRKTKPLPDDLHTLWLKMEL